MKKLFLFALVATMFAACVTDETQDVAVELAPDTLTVSFEDADSRIQLQNGKTVWTKNDLVSVFYLSDANQQWQYQGETGSRTGNLKRVNAGTATEKMQRVVVVYPYNENYFINTDTYNVKAFLPASQSYLKDSYGVGGNIMVSQGEYNQFSLKSVCGWLKLQLTGNGEKVKSIKLKGNNGEQVAGEIYINTADATATLAADMGGADDNENTAGGNLVFDDTILTEVVLDCGEGVELNSEATAFYIALPPQTFEKGINITVVYSDGFTMNKSTSNSIEIARNAIQPMSTLYYDGNVPPVYELAYTTNDGQPLDPYTTDGFGANFVENVYDATTGQGSLKFDGRITTIPEKAFIACYNLSGITLTDDIKAIGAEAFSSCSAIAIMDIPNSVTTIGNKAFYSCSGMQEITIPISVTSIGKSSFEGCGGKANINCKIARVSSEKEGYFYNAEFTEIIIGNSVTSIGALAFYDCDNLTTITIPDSVTKIGQTAFGGCKALSRVNAANLSAWCKISFDFVSKFDNGAAYYLTTNPLYYADLYIDGIEVIDIIIPYDVTEIKGSAFIGCDSFVKVVMHNDITSIGEYAFYNCSNLTSITISNSITSIKTNTFSGCSSLTNVTIPDSVTEIGAAAFSSCSSLTSVTIPNRVTSIGGAAFCNCSSLTSVSIPNRVTLIGDAIFYGCSSLTAFYGKFASADNRCLIIDGVLNSFAPAGLTEYTIPDNVTKIGVRAFRNCSSLTGVTIPDSVTSIGVQAFYDCNGLKKVYCKSTTPPAGGSSMFYNNASGRKIYVPTASVEAYKVADGWSSYASYIVGYDF